MSSLRKLRRGNLAQLREALQASMSRGRGMFVAIDVENTGMFRGLSQHLPSLNGQVGVSILDKGRITTYNFVMGSAKYYRKITKKPAFGTTVLLDKLSDFAKELRLLTRPDDDVTLVGHAIDNDLPVLKSLEVGFVKTPCTVFDTQELAKNAIPGVENSLALSDLLAKLDIKSSSENLLHIAGNDARFTLHALLLMALQIQPPTKTSPAEQQETVELQKFLVDGFTVPKDLSGFQKQVSIRDEGKSSSVWKR